MAVKGQTFFQSTPTTTFDDADRLAIQQNNLAQQQSDRLAIAKLQAANQLAIQGSFGDRSSAEQAALASQLQGQANVARIGNEPALGALGLRERKFDADQNTLRKQMEREIASRIFGGGAPAGAQTLDVQGGQGDFLSGIAPQDLLSLGFGADPTQVFKKTSPAEQVSEALALRQLGAINELTGSDEGGEPLTFREQQQLEKRATGDFSPQDVTERKKATTQENKFITDIEDFIARDQSLIVGPNFEIAGDPTDEETNLLAKQFMEAVNALFAQGEAESLIEARQIMLRHVQTAIANGTSFFGSEDQLDKFLKAIDSSR